MALFKQLSKIDDRTKYSVYGWIREAERSLHLTHIPMMINSICILFYRDDEIFDIIGKNVKVSSNKKCITKLEAPPPDNKWDNNTYGILEIPSMSNLIYKWDLKVCANRKGTGIVIGISSIETPAKDFEYEKGRSLCIYCKCSNIWRKN